MAILFVTVFVEDEETAVEASTFPVAAGKLSVVVPLTAGAARVIEPEVSPEITIELIV